MAISDLQLTEKSDLSRSELDDAQALVREANWNQVSADWRIFLANGRLYAAQDAKGRIVATTATLPYGGRFAWISMVLVAGDHRRRGLATQLMRRATDDLVSRGLVPALDATPDGRAVYRALGFEDCWGFHRLARVPVISEHGIDRPLSTCGATSSPPPRAGEGQEGGANRTGLSGPHPSRNTPQAGEGAGRAYGTASTRPERALARAERQPMAEATPAPEGVTIRALTEADWQALCRYDAGAFGADRTAVLSGLCGRLRAAELVAERDGRIVGFLLGRDGRVAAQIGPLVAEDDATARALLARAIDALDGALFIDLADAKTEVRAALEGRGFRAVRPLTRMLYRRSTRFDDGARTFAVIGPEFG